MADFYLKGFEKAAGKKREDNSEEGWLRKKGNNLRDSIYQGRK